MDIVIIGLSIRTCQLIHREIRIRKYSIICSNQIFNKALSLFETCRTSPNGGTHTLMRSNDIQTIPRRALLKGIGGGIALGMVPIGMASASSDELASELNLARSATRKYRDIQQARADGYSITSEYVPQMGFHLVNPAFIASDETATGDITKPPILVYFTTGNYSPAPFEALDPAQEHNLRLGAVEYAHGGDAGPPGTPADYFSDEQSRRRLLVSEEEGWNWTPGPNVTALHVWVHRVNPAGIFAPSNPTIH